MIKDSRVLEKFKEEITKEERLSFEQNLAIFEAMWREGVSLGILPPRDPLEGIDVDIKIAGILSCLKKF